MKTLYIEENWDETPVEPTLASNVYEYTLTDTERLCFNCPLDDCKENSKKCLINRAKKNK